MSCWQTVQDYGLRSLGIGERLLPREGFTLCEQVTLIGSGLLWNIYFGALALLAGFFLATALAVGKGAQEPGDPQKRGAGSSSSFAARRSSSSSSSPISPSCN